MCEVIEGLPIWVDRFTQRTRGGVYFLSHAHTDHIYGLSNSWCFGTIYCSPVTKQIIGAMFPRLDSMVEALEIGEPHLVWMDDQQSVNLEVILIDANHCPGSSMFYFRGGFGKVLYTGDFKMCDEIEASLSDVLMDETLDMLFYDNTLQDIDAPIDSQLILTELVCRALELYPKNFNIVIGVENLGKEMILARIAKHLECKVLVDKKRLRLIRDHTDIPADTYFTLKSEEARISLTPRVEISPSKILELNKKRNMVGVCLMASPGMRGRITEHMALNSCKWTVPIRLRSHEDLATLQATSPLERSRCLLVPYTLHSSKGEIEWFLKLLRPREMCGFAKKPKHHPDFEKYKVGIDFERKMANTKAVKGMYAKLKHVVLSDKSEANNIGDNGSNRTVKKSDELHLRHKWSMTEDAMILVLRKYHKKHRNSKQDIYLKQRILAVIGQSEETVS